MIFIMNEGLILSLSQLHELFFKILKTKQFPNIINLFNIYEDEKMENRKGCEVFCDNYRIWWGECSGTPVTLLDRGSTLALQPKCPKLA